MKIGLLTYHYVYNFGANLQVLSTLWHLLSKGYDVKIIDWRPKDTQVAYNNITSKEQRDAHAKIWSEYYKLTDLCETKKDVLSVIEKERFDAVVIGSDAVLQYRPVMSELRMTRKFLPRVFFRQMEQTFPNPYFGLVKGDKIKVAYISVSAQNSPIKTLSFWEKRIMRKYLESVSFFTVRDTWTQDYIRTIENRKRTPPITPDPVFSFNSNCKDILDVEEKKFWLKFHYLKKQKYILVSFKKQFETKDNLWAIKFEKIALNAGYVVYSLPYPQEAYSFGLSQKIDLPLSPLEWYLLIKNSCGYVGNNMHPIVTSIHNKVPFFVFDNYTKKEDIYSSKIYDLLNKLGLLDYYYNILDNNGEPIPEHVFLSLVNFDNDTLIQASNVMQAQYTLMMKCLDKFLCDKNRV